MTPQGRVAERGRGFASADKPPGQGEQLPAAGKGPAKGTQEVPAVGEIMGRSSHPCPTKKLPFPRAEHPTLHNPHSAWDKSSEQHMELLVVPRGQLRQCCNRGWQRLTEP